MASTKDEIKSWLEVALKNENLENLSVNIVGNSEVGDGYMGDIVFVTVNGAIKNNGTKVYNLVLKCSKRSEALRKTTPVQAAFLNEIFIYEKILPYYTQFQKENGIHQPFDSFPKCYGFFTGKNMEVIVFENLKSLGYELWPKKQPLTREHIDIMVTEYGKLHATSVALQNQRPQEFQNLVDGLHDVFGDFTKTSDMNVLFGAPIDESYELLKEELDEGTLLRWKNFKRQIDFVLKDMIQNHNGLKVILHGDWWNNNFMHLHEENGKEKIPLKVAFLDWQVSRYCSPILDLSYFLFACLSKEDMEEMEDILTTYHRSFVNQLKGLGTKEAEILYPYKQFLEDWNNFCKYGILMTALLMKIVSTDKDEVLDIAQVAENGKDFNHAFLNEIRDKENYKSRIRSIVEYAVKNNLI